MMTTNKTERNNKTKKNDANKATQTSQNRKHNMIKMNDTYTNVDIDKVCMYCIINVWYCVVVLERVVSFDPWVQTQKSDEDTRAGHLIM